MNLIKNDFHNTEYHTRKTDAEIQAILDTAPWDRSKKDKQWVYRVWSTLCGIKDCTCSNDIGAR